MTDRITSELEKELSQLETFPTYFPNKLYSLGKDTLIDTFVNSYQYYYDRLS